jgi:hypothetical protein
MDFIKKRTTRQATRESGRPLKEEVLPDSPKATKRRIQKVQKKKEKDNTATSSQPPPSQSPSKISTSSFKRQRDECVNTPAKVKSSQLWTEKYKPQSINSGVCAINSQKLKLFTDLMLE